MCWLTPKFEEGRSAKALTLKSGFSSQSGGRSLGLFDDFGEGLGEGPGRSGEKDESVEDATVDAVELLSDPSFCEELLELVEAKQRLGPFVDDGTRYCHPTLTSRRLELICRCGPWRSCKITLLAYRYRQQAVLRKGEDLTDTRILCILLNK